MQGWVLEMVSSVSWTHPCIGFYDWYCSCNLFQIKANTRLSSFEPEDVMLHDEIHAAKYVTKTHTTNVATFHTPTHGPLGIIMKHDILWFKTAEPRVRFNLEQITGTVPIIKAYAGMGIGDGIISLLDPEKIDGVVIEALGAGNLPPLAAREITKLMEKGVPVVLVSRLLHRRRQVRRYR